MRRRHPFPTVRLLSGLVGMIVIGAALAGCTSGAPDTDKTSTSVSNPTATQELVENEMLQNGIQQAGKGDYDDATSTFKAILAIDPKAKYALYNLGLIAQIHDQSAEAISYYQKAVQIDPKFTSAMYNEAIVLEPTDRKQAESLYEQIVKIDPKASTAYLRLSFLYRDDGDTAKANAARASALKLDPSLANVTPTPAPTK